MAAAGGKITLTVRRRLKTVKTIPPLKGTYMSDSSMSRKGNADIRRHHPALIAYILKNHDKDALDSKKYFKEQCYIIPSLLGKPPNSYAIAVKYIFGKLISPTQTPSMWKPIDTDPDKDWYVLDPSTYVHSVRGLSRDIGMNVVLSSLLYGKNVKPIPGIECFCSLKYFVYYCFSYSRDIGRAPRYAT